LPSDLRPGAGDRISGTTCPDCFGSLHVRSEAKGRLHFTCRIGHAYSLNNVLVAKEVIIEQRLWTAVTALEEFAALLRDVEVFRQRYPASSLDGRLTERARVASDSANALREIIARNRPITLDGDVEGVDEEPRG
jgi:two-component system chemotaxis response regulator CheB